MHDDADRLREKQLPILSAMTQNDRLLEWQLPVELAQHCGATDAQITYLDESERIVAGPSIGLSVCSILRYRFSIS